MRHTNMALLLLLTLFSISNHAVSFDFEVGDQTGWAVPSLNATHFYNQWASKNRFIAGDTITFRYMKDSVMQVSEDEYNKCSSERPIFFANNGKTEFKLDRQGMFYFISGAWGHCDKGERMIIRVMSRTEAAPGDSPSGDSETDYTDSSAGAALSVPTVSTVFSVVVGFVSFLVRAFLV